MRSAAEGIDGLPGGGGLADEIAEFGDRPGRRIGSGPKPSRMMVESSMRAAGVGGRGSDTGGGVAILFFALGGLRRRKQAIFHGSVVRSRLGTEEAESAVGAAGDEHRLRRGQGDRIDSGRMMRKT